MAEAVRVKIEVERVVNLIEALGWNKVEERVEDDTLTVTIKKKITPIGTE